MVVIGKTYSRRAFIGLCFSAGAYAALPGCLRRTRYSFRAEDILHDIRRNDVLDRMSAGQVTLLHKDLEGLSENGRDALIIIQRGLVSLGLTKTSRDEFNFGVYGDETARAVNLLQKWAKVDDYEEINGRKFGQASLAALEIALQYKSNNAWVAPRDI